MVTVAAAKRIRALLQNQPERQKRQEARVELRKRIRDQGIALTERMDHERTLHLRADTALTARAAADMGAPPPPPPPSRKRARSPPPPPRPRLPLSARSPSTGGSVGSLIARFDGLGYPGGAPPLRPARRERQLSRYNM